MKKFLFATTFLAVVLYSCTNMPKQVYEPPQRIEQPAAPTQPIDNENNSLEETIDETLPNPTITLASFNIQIFGKSKREKEDVMNVLTDIVQQYDITAIQEVRDSSEKTVPYFVSRLNSKSGKTYDYVVSPRLGRTSSKEQYVFVYDTKTMQYTGKSFVWDDSNDIFEREPFAAQFKSGDLDFILVNIHTKPDDAGKEIMALEQVMKDTDAYFTDDNDVIVLGDYNSDGSYFSETINTGFRANTYYWVIGDDQDTTVAASDNTYDRIVFNKEFTQEDYTGESGIVRFDQSFNLAPDFTKKVSDHYPVWAVFYTNKDSD